MYDIGQHVYVKSLDKCGEVTERNWLTTNIGNRRATYIVKFGPTDDYMAGSSDLIPADWQCDGCGKWHSESDTKEGPRDEEGCLLATFCFLCVRVDRRSQGYE